jgi:hypothetical protein
MDPFALSTQQIDPFAQTTQIADDLFDTSLKTPQIDSLPRAKPRPKPSPEKRSPNAKLLPNT